MDRRVRRAARSAPAADPDPADPPADRGGPLNRPSVTVRRATPEDAPAIARIEAVASPGPWSEAAVRSTLAARSTVGWVAAGPTGDGVGEEPVVGHLLASCVAPEGEILTVAVHPDARRRGYGAALLAACAQAWREAGVTEGWLEVRRDNDGARALYAGCG
ncbi:MAG: GNAT family N-acetyltransferase, partial [Myxococcota bacterium]